LRFLRLHKIGHAEQMKLFSGFTSEHGAPLPQHSEIREVAQACHDVDSQLFDAVA